MRTLPGGLAQHLAGGATTLCHCWRVALRGGEVLGFTDHDRDLVIDGTLYEAEAGFTASEIESSLGLSVDNLEASGALSSARLSEARLKAGDFDNAAVELWRVNWQDVGQRVLLKKGHVGEVTRGRGFFTAELRGLSHVLNEPRGRLYQYGCDAVLGDQRCGVDLGNPDFAAAVQVNACRERRILEVSGASGFAAGFFAHGTLAFATGANAGRGGAIKFHRVAGALVSIELWQPLLFDAAAGDQLVLRAGCDKQFSTCRAKFNNAANFRGFPHMPGDDFVLGYAVKKKTTKGRG
ncbi:DUF2163 domain-containing protein [Aestuariivirga sp.]|uniref:DUF2163 domain-containing protein n=1 Tax=Aestuariivirga sp. TaxID=2650926 RepID=UPI0025C2C763|nr:DUF2163 domain-containing protein [Aestuariivirga sp.]MCA3555310.1 DUF2163 domain-containing protein [Aestuariivirga sp.]